MRKRFLKWLIKILLPGFHLSRNPVGVGRKKKVEKTEGLGDSISKDYRTSHLTGNFPGENMGD